MAPIDALGELLAILRGEIKMLTMVPLTKYLSDNKLIARPWLRRLSSRLSSAGARSGSVHHEFQTDRFQIRFVYSQAHRRKNHPGITTGFVGIRLGGSRGERDGRKSGSLSRRWRSRCGEWPGVFPFRCQLPSDGAMTGLSTLRACLAATAADLTRRVVGSFSRAIGSFIRTVGRDNAKPSHRSIHAGLALGMGLGESSRNVVDLINTSFRVPDFSPFFYVRCPRPESGSL